MRSGASRASPQWAWRQKYYAAPRTFGVQLSYHFGE
jgi:hypothetical protein